MCGQAKETVKQNTRWMLAQKEYKQLYDCIGKGGLWEVYSKFSFSVKEKWYEYQ